MNLEWGLIYKVFVSSSGTGEFLVPNLREFS